jgi:hypothetical protein
VQYDALQCGSMPSSAVQDAMLIPICSLRQAMHALDRSKVTVNLVSRCRIRNRKQYARSSRSMGMLRACCATQALVGWAVITGQPHAPPPHLDDEQHEQPGQADGLDGEEVTDSKPPTWLGRNWVRDGPPRRGAGPSQCLPMPSTMNILWSARRSQIFDGPQSGQALYDITAD